MVSTGFAGFLLASTLAAINAFYALRGSVIVVQPPQQALLYRDGDGDNAVLTIAMRLAMINAADGQHGDVLMKASISPIDKGPNFGFAGTVQPVFTDNPLAEKKCDIGVRCIKLRGLLAIERDDEIVDVPGGAVKAPYLAYPISDSNCEGPAAQCAKFGDFEKSVATLANKPSKFTVNVKYYRDGVRRITCSGRAVDMAYLRKVGWMTIRCKQVDISRSSIF
ncbi:hypothetical protein [Sphingomonas sp.]|uniref:hypothetical protein n=1 Tax=Sphingomonas sp. TaxID=28214 RepID=UPI0025FCE04D|nr:hypothetical protein [Sphingomonas sp.]